MLQIQNQKGGTHYCHMLNSDFHTGMHVRSFSVHALVSSHELLSSVAAEQYTSSQACHRWEGA